LEKLEMKKTVIGKKHSAGVLSAVLCILGVLSALFYWKIYRVEPAFSTAAYELGDDVSENPADYLVGTHWSQGLGELDLSGVDREHAGNYEAYVRHGSSIFTYSIIIEDTTPPRIVEKEGQVYLAAGVENPPEALVERIEDEDSHVETWFLYEGEKRDRLLLEEPGEYALEVMARDSAGNQSGISLSVIVDTPPDLDGIRDFYMVPGSQPDYLDGVTASDIVDGDLTEGIRVDDSQVSSDSYGVYQVSYTVADECGLETTRQARVTVAPPSDIQGLIGERLIDHREDVILGAPNLYDAGAAPEDDLEETLEYFRPVLVQLYHEKSNGYSSGSGYIMEITDDTVYICSNRHVAGKYQKWDVFFYDGTRAEGKLLGCSDKYDVGVVTVAAEDIQESVLDQLMTVHIDKSYWEKLDDQAVELGLERVDREGGILHTTTGNLIKVKQYFEWYDQREHTEVTVRLEHGDSGSAILDGYGNLISMAYAYSTDPRRYWSIPLDGIVECYEEITGRELYVY